MHMMQYSWLDMHNTDCNLARHTTVAMQGHIDKLLMMKKYVDDTSDRGLVLSNAKWNGSKDHEFIISG